MLKRATILLFMISTIGPVVGANEGVPIPDVDVDSNCRSYVETLNDNPVTSKRIQKSCVENEQSSYDRLKDIWETLNEDQKHDSILRAEKMKPAYFFYSKIAYFAELFSTTNNQRRERLEPVPRFQR